MRKNPSEFYFMDTFEKIFFGKVTNILSTTIEKKLQLRAKWMIRNSAFPKKNCHFLVLNMPITLLRSEKQKLLGILASIVNFYVGGLF